MRKTQRWQRKRKKKARMGFRSSQVTERERTRERIETECVQMSSPVKTNSIKINVHHICPYIQMC